VTVDSIRTLLEQYPVFEAFWVTIKLAVFSAFFAGILGTFVAILRVSPIAILRFFGTAYVNIIRNTPLTLIMVFCYLGIWVSLQVSFAAKGSPTYVVDNFFRLAVLGLSVYHASFVAEALRSGVNTVPTGQAEAARALGLSFVPSLRLIVLPQAFRGAIAPLGNTLIALTKNTTVAYAISVHEASWAMKNMIEFNADLLFFTFFIMAVGFVILTLPVGVLFTWLSKRLAVQR
jgi:glutamate transport system permease protein